MISGWRVKLYFYLIKQKRMEKKKGTRREKKEKPRERSERKKEREA